MPLQVAVVCAVLLPNEPALQLPLHAAPVKPVVEPYVPAGHGEYADAFPVLNCPIGHTIAVLDTDPGGQ